MSAVPLLDESSTVLADLDPNPLVILNQERRIVYANPAARALNGSENGEQIEGLKLGEVLRCIHSQKSEGCGDTPDCLYCGANLAIRLGLGGKAGTTECRITTSTGVFDSSLEYSIQSRPVEWKGEQSVFCALNDISHEKRRRVLERTFFHDIMNTAGSVKGLSEALLMESRNLGSEDLAELLKMMRDSCEVMVDEIRSQQMLLAAESGHLTMDRKQVIIANCIAEASMVASHWPAGATKQIVPVYQNGQTTLATDPALLGRVLMNLLKNALEATPDGGEVRVDCRVTAERVEFSVWNAGVIPQAAHSQIFQRSFSTKGPGRGTGTYSVRLFTEAYLKGSVSFTSNSQDGTTFTVSIPLQAVA